MPAALGSGSTSTAWWRGCSTGGAPAAPIRPGARAGCSASSCCRRRAPTAARQRWRARAAMPTTGSICWLATRTARSSPPTSRAAAISITALAPGVHLLTNLELNDPTCPRIAKSLRLFQAVPLRIAAEHFTETLLRLGAILSDHGTALDPREAPSDTLCVHRAGYGTRSSSVIAHFAAARRTRFWDAAGPPCRFPYTEIPLPG